MQRDKELIQKRFSAKFEQYHRLAHTQRQIADRLAAMLAPLVDTSPVKALEIGAGTGFLTAHLARLFPGTYWYINDLAPAAESYLSPLLQGIGHDFLWGDAEKIAFPAGIDLIASASTVSWFDDMPRFLKRGQTATRPGGYLALATFGPDNFHEIRALTGRGLKYHDIREITGYEIVARDEYHEEMVFDSPMEVLRYIRTIGVNALGATAWTPQKLARFEADYRARFASRLTYHPLLLVARRKKNY